MYEEKHQVTFNLLDEDDSESIYEYKILLILNKPKSKNQLKKICQKADQIVFSNGCWKEIFDEYG
jgi:hypothetical protein